MDASLRADAQDLSETLTSCARVAALTAGDKGVGFFFDYRGPSFDATVFHDRIRQIVEPLLDDAVGALRQGCVFFSVDVVPHMPGRATVLMQVARTGTPASEPVLQRLIHAIQAAPSGFSEDLAPAEADAAQVCERLAGSLIVGDVPKAGRVVRADVLLPCKGLTEDITSAAEHGLSAWLLGEPPIIYESIVRRLHRLGWQVQLLPTVDAARERYRRSGVAPEMVVGAERYRVVTADLAAFAEGLPPASAVFATLLSHATVQTDERGRVGRVQVFASPFSPHQLHQITVRALANARKMLRACTAPQMALERRPRVLLVEDNLVNQILSTEILHLFGFEVDVANNGREAVEHCQQNTPSLIVMDLDMPVMDGLEAARQIRELERQGGLPHIAIVAATARATDADRLAAQQAGMEGFVPKPFDLAFMQKEIDRVLQRRSAAQEAAELPHPPS
ncbi:response regulator [Caldimonas brevitalea]|uniref:Sensory box histidine kinase/response regulator n=1 Tax=Caldimonas brevitalea TaxID=413882 RepID=A0A0G3BJ19_9BURK|nr:response regulator [Caldimonas brevitalea]AKJ27356.1 sensory box histidine kinase/response regulator [Caldimonas brevitalea]